jgi:hypothetical protein
MDAVLRRYPGYTVASLLEADAHELALLRELIGWSDAG